MDLKKIGKALLFPHIAIMIVLLPISAVLLVGSMVFVGSESVIAYASYFICAYTLTVWCFRIPWLIKFFKAFRNENKYARLWRNDARLRVKVSLYGTFRGMPCTGFFNCGLAFITAPSGSILPEPIMSALPLCASSLADTQENMHRAKKCRQSL